MTPIWHTLTNVRFAVLQITLLVVAGLIGTLVLQLPSYALRDPAGYATEMANMHAKYDPLTLLGANVGPQMVDIFERLGFFRVFSAPWFIALMILLTVSITVCTLDRTPKLWRSVRRVTVEQPDAFFDPRLNERARFETWTLHSDEVAQVLHDRRFRVRRASSTDGAVDWLYGDRNQYIKMATLLTHLGLILFLLGGAITVSLGFETVVFAGEGQTVPVQPAGTPHNMMVRNVRFEAPQRPNGAFADFRTDLMVYRDGREIARKTIRVNDPLEVDGFVFHQNTFGPAADLEIRDTAARLLWTGPVLLTGQVLGRPQGFLVIPGSSVGMAIFLQRDSAGTPILAIAGLAPMAWDGSQALLFEAILGVGATSDPAYTSGYAITWVGPGAFTGMVIKNDPGAPFIWLAFLSLISGLLLTFYLPRRRLWARVTGSGLQLAFIADRYVDANREFRQILEEIAARNGHRPEQKPSG